MERLDQTRIEEIYKSMTKYSIKYNYTVTIDSKKMNLSEAWAHCHKALSILPIGDLNIRTYAHLIVVECHKGKNLYPHFHGQIAVNRLLQRYELININEHLRRMFGRSNFIKNMEENDPVPSFISQGPNEKRDWTEYILKDVLKTQDKVLDYPIASYWVNPRFFVD